MNKVRRGFNRALGAALAASAVAVGMGANAMIFKSSHVGAHWDTWAYHHLGTYYVYYLITEYGYGEGVGLISSQDGVHWRDHGRILQQSPENSFYLGSGAVWKAADFEAGGRFIMNYSEHRTDAAGKQTQNILFAWSTNLVDWVKYPVETMFAIDGKYYDPHGRWDCIFAFPREEGGYWGTWSATGREVAGTVGIGYSEDGLAWVALPPPTVEVGANEAGAFYPIGDQVYGMFIAHPDRGIWSYHADSVHGPYRRPVRNAHLLQRGPTAFARFFPTEDGLLANHYQWTGTRLPRTPRSVGRDREITYVATFKRIELDEDGILRWRYWEGNEALKGRPLDFGGNVGEYDLNTGLVLEADVTLPAAGEAPVSLSMHAAGREYVARVLAGGVMEMEALGSTDKGWRKTMRADREWPFGASVRLRLLLRAGMMEAYLDDQFMECWTMMGSYGAATVRLSVGDDARLANPVLWRMSLEPAAAPPIGKPR